MYPELYPELDGGNRKLRGFALSLVGGFMFAVTTIATVVLSSPWLCVAVSGLSLSAVALVFAAHKSRSFLSQVTLLMAASGTLAAETGLVALLFPVPLAGVCAVMTLVGSLVAARGIHDVESIAPTLEPFSAKRRREIAVSSRPEASETSQRSFETSKRNSHPGFLDDAENYSKLTPTLETENGVEIATFEVPNPQAWERSLKNHVAKKSTS
jgi:hypothetical protein